MGPRALEATSDGDRSLVQRHGGCRIGRYKSAAIGGRRCARIGRTSQRLSGENVFPCSFRRGFYHISPETPHPFICLVPMRELGANSGLRRVPETASLNGKCPALGSGHTMLRPSCLPNSQDTPLPRTTAIMVCPTRCSITGFHGTKLNPMPSSIMAKRPLVSRTFRR
jgi:hypothetical protein